MSFIRKYYKAELGYKKTLIAAASINALCLIPLLTSELDKTNNASQASVVADLIGIFLSLVLPIALLILNCVVAVKTYKKEKVALAKIIIGFYSILNLVELSFLVFVATLVINVKYKVLIG